MATKSIDVMKVLIVDDKEKEADAIKEALKTYGFMSDIDILHIKSLNDLVPQTKEKYFNYDILFFDLKFDKTVEEGLDALETLMREESNILLTAVYIITSSPDVARKNPKVKALMLDVIEKDDPENVTHYVREFNNVQLKETVEPIVDTYSQFKERLKNINANIEISEVHNKVNKLLSYQDLMAQSIDNILLSNKTILSLMPDAMDKSKRAKAQKFIEEQIDNIEFPENLKRGGIVDIVNIVKEVAVDSIKDGIKKGSMTLIKEKLGEGLKEALVEKAKGEGVDAENAVYAGMYFAQNIIVDLAKYIGVNPDT